MHGINVSPPTGETARLVTPGRTRTSIKQVTKEHDRIRRLGHALRRAHVHTIRHMYDRGTHVHTQGHTCINEYALRMYVSEKCSVSDRSKPGF